MTQEHIHADKSSIELIGALTKAACATHQVENTTHLVLPPEYKHIDITKLIENAQQTPNRKIGTAQLTEIESFIDYVKLQGVKNVTIIYADPDTRTLTAVFIEHDGFC
jgi:uncharacterized protein YfdQ (DUF2303 family)